jgi:hypothetical protein
LASTAALGMVAMKLLREARWEKHDEDGNWWD